MDTLVIVILLSLSLLFCIFSKNYETFVNTNVINPNISYNEYKQLRKIKHQLKDDYYMNFMGDLNTSYNKYLKEANKESNSPIKQKALCDDRVRIKVQKDALNEAFNKVPEKDLDKDSKLFDKNVPESSKIDFYVGKNRVCGNKASHLCELTNPMLYMSQNPHFPPRWIFKPYRDVPLPKHTDLKCWNNMLNCCKTHIN
jgi:hypothetical protein